jgi:hypothetical protein
MSPAAKPPRSLNGADLVAGSRVQHITTHWHPDSMVELVERFRRNQRAELKSQLFSTDISHSRIGVLRPQRHLRPAAAIHG